MQLTESQKAIVEKANRQRAQLGFKPMNDEMIKELFEGLAPDPGPTPVARKTQLVTRRNMGLMNPDSAEHRELKAILEGEEKEAAAKWPLEQLSHRATAGLIDAQTYLTEKRALQEKLSRKTGGELILEGDPAAKKKALREAYNGKRISLSEYMSKLHEVCSEEVEEGTGKRPDASTWMGRRRLLTEQHQPCGDDCAGCRECRESKLVGFKRLVDQLCASGRCTIEQRDRALTFRRQDFE